jgi:hypothetical protein
MLKGDILRVESISSKLKAVLERYKELIDGGCNDGCEECIFSKVIIKKMPLPYEYSNCEIHGEVTICDLLGLLLVKGKDALLS